MNFNFFKKRKEIIEKGLEKIALRKSKNNDKNHTLNNDNIDETKNIDNEEKKNNIDRNYIILEEDNAYGISHKGNRTNNEDYILIKKIKDIYLLAVADGIGGHNAGDVASKMAIDVLKDIISEKYNENLSIEEIEELLNEVYNTAHKKIKENAIGDKEGMGTTLTIAIIKGDICIIANTGDSRAYLIRDGEIIFRTKDHSLVQTLIDEGHISEDEARLHPMKNIITSALGLDEIKIDNYVWELEEGDILLLSSDGLHDYVSKEDILKIVRNNDSPKDIVNELLKTALKETRDNVSIIVYKKQ